jgi:ubiquinone/menaquinone biosynthesis C-methylase UbiE
MTSETKHVEAITGKEEVRRYASHRRYSGLMFGSLIKTIKQLELSGRYLEMGAGPGFLAIMLAERLPSIDITAVDLSHDMKDVAEEFILEKKLEDRIHYILGDAANEQLSEKQGMFDLVYTTFSMHHWKEPEKSIRNLWKAVHPGGALCILDICRIGWLCSLPLKVHMLEEMRAAYTGKEIKTIFMEMGVADCQVKRPFPYFTQIVVARK